MINSISVECNIESYVKFEKQYYRNAPYDWISAVLKFYKTNTEFVEQHSGAETQIIELEKNRARAYAVSPVGVSAPVGIRTRVSSSKG